jgi:branched-subunit amino acid transport protein
MKRRPGNDRGRYRYAWHMALVARCIDPGTWNPEPGTPRKIIMETKRLIMIFLGMWAVTYFPRMLPLVALSQVRLPGRLMTWLSYLPASILAALIFPGALMTDGRLDVTAGNPAVWALLISFAVAVRTRNLILTMLTGGLVVFVGQLII